MSLEKIWRATPRFAEPFHFDFRSLSSSIPYVVVITHEAATESAAPTDNTDQFSLGILIGIYKVNLSRD